MPGIFNMTESLAPTRTANQSSQKIPWSMNTTTAGGRQFQTTDFGDDGTGKPNILPFETVRDGQGNLGSQYRLQGGGPISLDTSAYNKYLNEATSVGPSSWASAAMDLNRQNTANSVDAATQAGASANADAMSNLQMTGGMNGSQRERLAIGNQRDMMRTRMDAINTGNTNQLGILSDDAKNKLSMLPTAQNMSLQNSQFNQNERDYADNINKFNIGNTLQDVSNFNNYNSNNYSSAMSGWAANKSSEAQANAANAQSNNKGIIDKALSWIGL